MLASCQFSELATFAHCSFIFALRNIALNRAIDGTELQQVCVSWTEPCVPPRLHYVAVSVTEEQIVCGVPVLRVIDLVQTASQETPTTAITAYHVVPSA